MFSSQLRAERERLNLSQRECADLFPALASSDPPLSGRMIANWEQGTVSPPGWVQALIMERLAKRKPRKSGSFAKAGQPKH